MPIAKLTIPSFGNGEFICPTPDYLTCERLENVASEGDNHENSNFNHF